jgi:hypothetical protein
MRKWVVLGLIVFSCASQEGVEYFSGSRNSSSSNVSNTEKEIIPTDPAIIADYTLDEWPDTALSIEYDRDDQFKETEQIKSVHFFEDAQYIYLAAKPFEPIYGNYWDIKFDLNNDDVADLQFRIIHTNIVKRLFVIKADEYENLHFPYDIWDGFELAIPKGDRGRTSIYPDIVLGDEGTRLKVQIIEATWEESNPYLYHDKTDWIVLN